MIIGEESEILEFKLTTGERREATEAIVAILNKHCKGTLYFGIDDNGYVKGQQVSDSTKKDISRISIVGNGIIRNYDFIKNLLDIIQKNKLEMLEFNVSESKISVDFKGIVDDKILKEIHDKNF